MSKKLSYDQMAEWSNKIKDSRGNGINYLRLNPGIHYVRIIPDGTENDMYFRSFTQHDTGQAKEFRSWPCHDYVLDNKQLREHLAEKDLLTEDDAKKIKKYGDPFCTTYSELQKYVKDVEMLRNLMRTKTRCILNVFYIFQAYSTGKIETPIKPQNYVWEISAAMNKQIIQAAGAEIGVEQIEIDELLSVEAGKMLAIQVEGEGIGKNKRTYAFNFKGKPCPIFYCEDSSNPFQKGANRVSLPDDFQVYNLLDVETSKYISYQEVVNHIKSIPAIKRILDQIGYQIPGDESSDNPLDDNYDPNIVKTVGKPIKKELKEDSPIRKAEMRVKEEWEDEDVIEKEKEKIREKVPNPVKDYEEDEVFDDLDDELNEFERMVPPSDPKKEVITNAPKKQRKIF